MTALVPRPSAELSTDRHDPRDPRGDSVSTEEMPATIQAIIDADSKAAITQPTVTHEIVFAYDGNVIANFSSAGSIQLPTEGATITLHHHQVTVTGLDLDYAVVDGIQHVTAEVEVEPA